MVHEYTDRKSEISSWVLCVIERRDHVRRVRGHLREFRICAILGARQVGKTTLADQVAPLLRRVRAVGFAVLDTELKRLR